MRVAIATLVATVAVGAVACGGGSKHLSASEVRRCLVDKSLAIKPADLPGDVAPDGTQGNLAVLVGGDEVDLAFGRDAGEAKSNADNEKALASVALGGSADDYVRTKGNVAYWVTGTDTSAFGPVEECLR